ncbi:hypothetical protein BWZ20_05075 [Winogradskyella sp. J14-2]|uniref:glycosyltransferase family 2 protein n=1 Tax=Winogradskyella sp. J14-2 TaxID=1936080 RepID=UPI000972C40B|nr:glycosyltransferase family A protein [Winogradskyella sp. J14-2]APY07704.1 hypothetical protein BWZ20_05075 [Winogradskyella sp. J14-2]
MPYFSVVITVYNKAEFIKSTINSVLNQTFQDFEVIVINDGSTDESEHIIASFTDKRITLITTLNQGASVARNTGIKASNCNYIALLDGDDLWDRDFLKYIKDAITTFPKEKIYATALSQKYPSKTVPVSYSFKQKKLYAIRDYFRSSKKYAILSSSSTVFEKSIINKTGNFDPSIVSGQDIDLWIRFALKHKVVFINKPLAIYNHVTSSLSNTAYTLKNKSKFDKYLNEEKENEDLKAYLDLNRYSMALLSKFLNDKTCYNYYTSFIDFKNLTARQTVLLKSPKWLLKLLLKLKSFKGEKLYYPVT